MCSSVVPGSCAVYGRHGLPGLTLTFCHAAERLVAVIAEGPAPRSATAARHTGASAQRLEPVLLQERPDLVVVVSHVNSIVAARVHFVGNTMSDTQERLLPQARGGEVLEHMRPSVQSYGLGSRRPPSPMCSRGATQRSSSDSSARPRRCRNRPVLSGRSP